MMTVENDLLITLDTHHTILALFPQDSHFSKWVKRSILTCIDTNDHQRFINFMKRLNHQSAQTESLHLIDQTRTYPCQIHGFKEKDHAFLFVLFNHEIDIEILKSMMVINSQQVNQVRTLQKNMQLHDASAYEEISKLNSELLNSKRLIEKQNAKLKQFNDLLKKMAIEDTLTGCYNRRYFYEHMKAHHLGSQNQKEHALIFIDFNHFKKVNDALGHDAGDQLLKDFVQLSQKAIKDQGTIFRFGGDEFIVLLHGVEKAQACALMHDIEEAFLKKTTMASLSYGIEVFKDQDMVNNQDIVTLIKRADQKMYTHKKNSRR